METGLSKIQIVNAITRSPHGDLKQYVEVGRGAAGSDPEFFAHLIAWNHEKGQIRDSKVALPVVQLVGVYNNVLSDNALACLASLDPRNLVRAWRFAKEIHVNGNMGNIKRMTERYLRAREAKPGWWDRTAIQHRKSLKSLYALLHIRPAYRAEQILFKGIYAEDSIFRDIASLSTMSAKEAAGTILNRRIPFLIAAGALGAKLKEPDLVLAMIEAMTATELVTNSKMLERLGVTTIPAIRGAYEAKLESVAKSKKNVLKTSVAAERVTDEGLKAKLKAVQEKQIDATTAVEGNWLVLGDKSGSMAHAIELARHVAATLARFVKGEVYLVFFDTMPRVGKATGKTYEQILKESALITAGGGTSIGCGVQLAIDGKFDVDGIAIVSDGGENTLPAFAPRYAALADQLTKEIPIYFFKMAGESDVLSSHLQASGIDFQTFDLRHGQVDYYSLPDLVRTMRTNRYGLVQEIMDFPLKSLDSVLGSGEGE